MSSTEEPLPKDEIVFIQLKESCKNPSDILKIIEQIFIDIAEKKELKNFHIYKEQKAGIGGALVDSLILEPNFSGVGVNLKKVFSVFKHNKK